MKNCRCRVPQTALDALLVGVSLYYELTINDFQNYDDVTYTEFVPTSEEENDKLKQLFIEIRANNVKEGCISAIRYGHINELEDYAANLRTVSTWKIQTTPIYNALKKQLKLLTNK